MNCLVSSTYYIKLLASDSAAKDPSTGISVPMSQQRGGSGSNPNPRMHRAYQPLLPTHNKLLQKRWDDKYYSEHRDKVRCANPMVDTKPPPTYMHLHLKLKKLQLEEERLAQVKWPRENTKKRIVTARHIPFQI